MGQRLRKTATRKVRMRYVIMANGKGTRWGNYGGIPKHLISIDGETLLQRTTRLAHRFDPEAEVIISSSNEDYQAEGATRHAPECGDREIDRFCYELISDGVCFLYGDTFYTEETFERIVAEPVEDMLFFGTSKSIVAVRAAKGSVMRGHLDELIGKIESGELEDAKGWQLYHLSQGMPLEGREIAGNYVVLDDTTTDFNKPDEYESFIRR